MAEQTATQAMAECKAEIDTLLLMAFEEGFEACGNEYCESISTGHPGFDEAMERHKAKFMLQFGGGTKQ